MFPFVFEKHQSCIAPDERGAKPPGRRKTNLQSLRLWTLLRVSDYNCKHFSGILVVGFLFLLNKVSGMGAVLSFYNSLHLLRFLLERKYKKSDEAKVMHKRLHLFFNTQKRAQMWNMHRLVHIPH